MPLADTLLAEFDRETATTRKLIARIPAAKLDWKPHAKSATMGGIGRHLAHMVAWARVALQTSTFDIASRQPMPPTASPTEILSIFDDNVGATRDLIAGRSDDELNANWVLTAGGRSVIEMSRASVVESMVVHHMIHHRGQLSVYLRMNDISVPSIYGPSADESH